MSGMSTALRKDIARWLSPKEKNSSNFLPLEKLTAARATDPDRYWQHYGGPSKAVLLVGYAGRDFVSASGTGITSHERSSEGSWSSWG